MPIVTLETHIWRAADCWHVQYHSRDLTNADADPTNARGTDTHSMGSNQRFPTQESAERREAEIVAARPLLPPSP